MSKAGKVFLIGGLLFWGAMYAFRLVYGAWHPALWVPLALGFLLLLAGFVKDGRNIVAFFTMRTTKHGLNMGAVILIALIGLTCVNILAVKYNHKFDWTSDKLNSLSDQSVKVSRAITQDTRLVLLFRPDDPNGGENLQRSIRDLAALFQNVSTKISYESHNAIVDPATAKSYDYSAGPFAFFAQQGDRKLKIDQPTEEGVTRALIKLSRTQRKVVYFITGHGERDLDSKDPDGLSFLIEELRVTYDVRPLTLYSNENKVPADAAMVAVIRPTQQYLDNEIHGLREYVQMHAGKLLIALDPGMKQNLSGLSRSFGIDFNNDYVIDLRSRTLHMGPASVLGTQYPDPSAITQAFPESSFSLFQIASSLKKSVDAPKEAKIIGLVATDDKTMATSELGQVEYKPNGPHTIGMQAKSGNSEVIVFGDSDFMCNAFIQQNLNNDLALNIFADLASDKDLISIRPRAAKGTHLDMTRQNFNAYVLLFLIPLPILLFALGGFMFWRRRTA
jgi:ABC-type uncharacterized transport system involved in gliding motility auxiliary subunit